jgi:hypothetical protein
MQPEDTTLYASYEIAVQPFALKTLDRWINSSGHRKNLLMHEGERVGAASAKRGANGRTYWAMVIAGGYEKPKPVGAQGKTIAAKPKAAAPKACRLKLLGLSLPLGSREPSPRNKAT